MAIISYERKPGENLPPEEIARLQALSKKLEALDDSEIDCSDIPEMTAEELKHFKRVSGERRKHA